MHNQQESQYHNVFQTFLGVPFSCKFQHHHFGYDQDAGRAQFAAEVNRLFERNGIAYQLHDGQVERLVPTVLQEVLLQPTFQHGRPNAR